jgi:Tol biopolymer transport system component/DNA-binding winged helix-turn-helix (wHTH) protein
MSLNLDLIYSEFNLNVPSDSVRVVYVFEEFRVDATRRMLYRAADELALPPKAVDTLLALIERRGEIVSKDELMKTIWTDTIVEESNLAHYLHVLRKTLGCMPDGKPFIETLRRRGYRFTAEIRVIEQSAAPKPKDHDPMPGSEPKILQFADWRHENPAVPVSDRAEFETTADGQETVHWLHNAGRPIILAVAAFTIFFTLAAVLYFRFLPARPVRQAVVPGEVSVIPQTNGEVVLSATISPDGKYFVYHDSDTASNRLWLRQIGQSTRIEIIPTAERAIAGKTFSPNGEFIYFASREKGESKYALYRVPTLGGTLTKILDDVDSTVSFSPDARELAFVRYSEKTAEFQIVTAPVDGGEEQIRLAGSSEKAYFSSAAWSPDGKRIAFGSVAKNSPSGEGTCTLAAVEIQTGAVKNLSPEKWDTCFRMVWTPGGEGLVFIGTRAGESYTARRDQVFYLSAATGQSRCVTTDGSRYQDQSLGVTNENSILAVPSKRLSQIWAMDAGGDSRTAVQLTNGQADGKAGIAPLPDGRVGFISRTGETLSVWIMNADGTNEQQIYNQIPFVEELRATPDGRFFIFSGRRDSYSHLYRIDPDGSNLKQLTSGETYEIDSTVSPDSRWVYYGSNFLENGQWKTRLQKTAIETGETVELKVLDTLDLSASISPDGKIIAGITSGKLKFFSAADGATIALLDENQLTPITTGAKWTPDGKSLTYEFYQENSVNIWRQALNKTAAPRPLTDFSKSYIYFHAFSSDGTRLYLARGHHVRDAVLIKNWQ